MTYVLAKLIKPPKFDAIKYERYLKKRLGLCIKTLSSSLKGFFASNKIPNYRADDYVDDLDQLLKDIAAFMSSNDYTLIKDLFEYGNLILGTTSKQLKNSLKGILSVSVSSPSLALNKFSSPLLDKNIDLMLKSWVSTNTKLIKSIESNLLEQVGVIIESGYRSGVSATTLSQQIKSRFNVSQSRSRLIARDQTSKLHSNYIEYEHKQLNIKEYIWSTSDDERVRTSHKVLNQKVCQWSDPLTYRDKVGDKLKHKSSIGGVPLQCGIDFQCRCGIIAVIEL